MIAGAIPIVGAGIVNPVATGVPEFMRALWAALPRLSKIQHIPIPRGKSTVGLITDPAFDGPDKGLKMAVAAVTEALAASGVETNEGSSIGLILATMFGDSHAAENAYPELLGLLAGDSVEVERLYEAVRVYPNGALLASLRRHFGFHGPGLTVSNACASGNVAVGLALDFLRTRQCKAVVIVGVEVMKAVTLWGAERAGFVGNALLPFHINRDGAILGEGAAAIVMARPEIVAPERAMGWVSGFGSVCDRGAAPITLAEDGSGLLRAMQLALRDAGRSAEDVDYVNAHAPGTRMIDAIECGAIARLCGRNTARVAVNATKSITTHLSGASAVTEIVATLLQMRDGFLHGNASLDHPDPALALIPAGTATTARRMSFSLSNACGGGGLNTTIALSRAEPPVPAEPRQTPEWQLEPLIISGAGLVCDSHLTWRPASQRGDAVESGTLRGFDIYAHYPPESNYHYMNRAAQLAAAAAAKALDDAGIGQGRLPCPDDRFAVIFGTCLGGAPQASKVMCDGLRNNAKAITPNMSLDHGIHLGAALVCRHYGLTGTTYTLTGSRKAGLQALEVAALSIQMGRADAALIAGYDAYDPFEAALADRLGFAGPVADGAGAIVLERADNARRPGAPTRARLIDIKTFSATSLLGDYLATQEWDTLYLATHRPAQFRHEMERALEIAGDRREWVTLAEGSPDLRAGLGVLALIDAIRRGIPAAIVVPDLHGGVTSVIVAPTS